MTTIREAFFVTTDRLASRHTVTSCSERPMVYHHSCTDAGADDNYACTDTGLLYSYELFASLDDGYHVDISWTCGTCSKNHGVAAVFNPYDAPSEERVHVATGGTIDPERYEDVMATWRSSTTYERGDPDTRSWVMVKRRATARGLDIAMVYDLWRDGSKAGRTEEDIFDAVETLERVA
jgi:hypothetical protein